MDQVHVRELLDLTGKVGLVTGGARNLGFDMAMGLAEAGADVVITSRQIESARRAALSISTATQRRVLPVVCDVRFEDQAKAAVERALAEFGRLDILVNNAGNVESTPENAPLDVRPVEEWEKTVDVNLKGPFLLSKHAVALAMKPARRGSIINIGSNLGVVGKDRRCYAGTGKGGPTVDYTAAKGGVINMTRDMACYLASWNIRVNCVSPGGFHTDEDEEFARRFGEDVPMGRMGFLGKEIKGAVVFLASEAASYVTGINLAVDGGYTIW